MGNRNARWAWPLWAIGGISCVSTTTQMDPDNLEPSGGSAGRTGGTSASAGGPTLGGDSGVFAGGVPSFGSGAAIPSGGELARGGSTGTSVGGAPGGLAGAGGGASGAGGTGATASGGEGGSLASGATGGAGGTGGSGGAGNSGGVGGSGGAGAAPTGGVGGTSASPEGGSGGGCTNAQDCMRLDNKDLCEGRYLCQGGKCQWVADIVQCPRNRNSECGEARCVPQSGECRLFPLLPDGHACDDRDACTLDDRCAEGQCVARPRKPQAPKSLAPRVGTYTGSVYAGERVLRPEFQWLAAPADACPQPTYDIELDDSCESGKILLCTFPSPEQRVRKLTATRWRPPESLAVDRTPPVGRRYSWRVRACRDEECSEWTPVRYVDVGRVPNDFNGDGYSDVAAGSWGRQVFGGLVYIYEGSTNGLPTVPGAKLHGQMRFGASLASEDANGDGFADLLVGVVPVNIFWGGATGLGGDWGLPFPMPSSAEADNPYYGARLATAGDVNADGFADWLLSAAQTDGGEPRWAIWVAGRAAYSSAPDARWAIPVASPCLADCDFGAALSLAGDINSDGYADVVIGAPLQTTGGQPTGAAFVYLGAADGLSVQPITELRPASGQSHGFGRAVHTALDGNDDGYADILVGSEGQVALFLGSAQGVLSTPQRTLTAQSALSGDFGRALTAAPGWTGAGAAWGIGAPPLEATAGQGGLVIYPPGTSFLPQVLASFDVAASGFAAQVVSVGDVNGDGYADLAVQMGERIAILVSSAGGYSGERIIILERGEISTGPGVQAFPTAIADALW